MFVLNQTFAQPTVVSPNRFHRLKRFTLTRASEDQRYMPASDYRPKLILRLADPLDRPSAYYFPPPRFPDSTIHCLCGRGHQYPHYSAHWSTVHGLEAEARCGARGGGRRVGVGGDFRGGLVGEEEASNGGRGMSALCSAPTNKV